MRRDSRLLETQATIPTAKAARARIETMIMRIVADIQSLVCDTAELVGIICYYYGSIGISNNGDMRYKKLK